VAPSVELLRSRRSGAACRGVAPTGVGTVLPGRFRLDEELARGSFGAVYRARQLAVDRDVAIKLLHDDLDPTSAEGRLFFHEIRAVGRLDHPNVVRIYQADVSHDGRLFYAMELLRRTTLAALCADGPLPAPRAVALTGQLLAGLAAAHDAGLVHADVKPANAMVVEAAAASGWCWSTSGWRACARPSPRSRWRHAGLHGARAAPRRSGRRALGRVRGRRWSGRAAHRLAAHGPATWCRPSTAIADPTCARSWRGPWPSSPASATRAPRVRRGAGPEARRRRPPRPPFVIGWRPSPRPTPIACAGATASCALLVDHVLFRARWSSPRRPGVGKTSLLRAGLGPRLEPARGARDLRLGARAPPRARRSSGAPDSRR
jgi:hypothetical protein